ncbi:MAG: DegQ family serine endoprotease [Methylococcales symbiont of Hymedesmia sp. n. MRB-2018]|nr:MAG: DegQ family serine endoprotease [Methylococcales symbiont of Hymedesmia sp. n. MRB-2018]KAF3983245.1 MAG: DegQ family serine endoprotease [Methylococcales symbiont of Hymedesmia sp. n. MRB-2018]
MLKYRFFVFLSLLIISASALAQLPDFTSMVKEKGDAVVNISTTQKAVDLTKHLDGHNLPEGVPPQMEELFRHFFKQPGRGFEPRDAKSLGSGFIISQDGYVLTNHHVVKDADEIIVKLKDRRQLIAKLIGSDERTDIALLKVEAQNLPVVSKGSSKQLQVGEWVLAIGSPFGFEQSVTAGIVSAKGRSLPRGNYVPFIQTDVAINPGNSGGPLFNMNGEVIGVNSQIYSRSGGYMGLSFAIPIDVAMNVVEQLKTKGAVSRGWLGVQIQDVTRELAESFNMDKPYGALVSRVITDSPSEKAGFQIGDVIVEFDGNEIHTSGELPPIVGITPIGEKIKVKVIRQGKKKTIKVVIGLLADESTLASSIEPKKEINQLAIVVTTLTTEQAKKSNLTKQGVLVQSLGQGPALNAGIQQGDIILRIQNNVVRDVTDFDRIVTSLPLNQSIAILIQRGGDPIFLALKIDK